MGEMIHKPSVKTLKDVDGLQTRQLYIYKVLGYKDKGFIKEQTISILRIESFKKIIISRDDETQTPVQKVIQNDSKGNTANLINRLNEGQYTSQVDFTTGLNSAILIGSFEPLVPNNGLANTEVFLLEDIKAEYIVGVKDPSLAKGELKNPTDFSLANFKSIQENYQALVILFTYANNIVDPTRIKLELDNYSLLSKVMAKGVVDGKKHQDIDLKIKEDESSKLSVLTMTPTSTNYKLSMFSHWLDANRTLSFVKAKLFITKQNLKSLFNISNKDFEGWSATEITDAYKVVLSMMKLTQAYSTNFKDYRGSDNKITGEINGIALADFADKDPMNAIDGFVEAWKSKYPGQVDSPGFKILTEVIAMLSNHINSSYAIAKGNNDFMKVYLPWYFVPQTSITHSLAEDADFEVILKSEYFDFKNVDNLIIKDEYKDISGYVAHDLNGWISQAELPDKINPINKFSKPGDVDIKSDNDLKYLFYVPFIDNKVLENLYGELHTIKQSGWHDEGIVRRYEGSQIISRTHDMPPLVVPTLDESDAKRLIKVPLNARVKDGSITNIKTAEYYRNYGIKDVPFVGYVGEEYMGYTISFDYELQINGSSTISSIQHAGTIYDKLNWRSVANSLTNGNQKYSLTLIPNDKFNFKINEIKEINIQALLVDYISFELHNATDSIVFTDIELPTLDDETKSNWTILYG